MLNRNQKVLVATAITMGAYMLILAVVYSVFVNRQICQVSPFSCVEGVKFLGGESIFVVPASIVLFPILILVGGRWGMLVLFILSTAVGITGSFTYVVGIALGTRYLVRTPDCYLFGGNCLDHNLFHVSQLPFVTILMVFSYWGFRAKRGRTYVQRP